jgi:hypothetical protein
MTAVLKDFEDDEQKGVWQWFGVTSGLVEKARTAVLELRGTVFLRQGSPRDQVELTDEHRRVISDRAHVSQHVHSA